MRMECLRGAVVVACLGFLVCGICTASKPDDSASPPAAKPGPWKAEDIIFSETASQFRISPDAKWAVWVKDTGDKEKDLRVSNLVLTSLTEKKEIPLTRGADTNAQPRWSPNGELIAFLSTRPRPQPKPELAPTQIWLINAHGGEAWPLTELVRGVKRFEWLDSDTIIYSAEEDPTWYDQEIKKRKDDSQIVEDVPHTAPVRLFKIALQGGKLTRLTNNQDWIGTWAVSRDAQYVVASHERSLHHAWDQKVPHAVFIHSLANGKETQSFVDGRVFPRAFAWAPDNTGFYAIAPFSNDPRFMTATIQRLYFYDIAASSITPVNLDWENGLSFGFASTPDGFIALLAAGARCQPARYLMSRSGARSTWRRVPLEGEHARNIRSLTVSDDGRTLVYEYSTASKMPQWYRSQLEGTHISSPVQITTLNSSLAPARTFAKTEVIRWTGSQEEEVQGILYYPENYEPGKKYPLVLNIHGGPSGVDMDAWDEGWAHPVNLITQRGAFVLRPNYHGSGNYGLPWVESICCGKYYDLETPDIEKGVDALVAQGKVDPERIGTIGWSNGSILSVSLMIANPARYKAASVGAGDIEWISDWGNVDFGESFDSYYFGKSPLEDPELYIRKSPLFKMDRVRTPTLIFHGTTDRNVPTAQSWTFFRALQYYDKVPVRFVLFPGEPHGPLKLTHQMRKVEEEIAWFDRYLFKNEKAANAALKEDSPLGARLKRLRVQRRGSLYGTGYYPNKSRENKAGGAENHRSALAVLIPEVVKRDELEIGRFEVTRSQYAEFDKGYKIDPGTENYPASGITFATAKAYAAWLSKLTGEGWRIPGESEVASLYENRDHENTLDYWAGYALNPDDAAMLTKKAAELGGNAALLKEVGNFRGQGGEEEEPIYDLGGNVAEWVVRRDGSGKAVGGSAHCPADSRSTCTPVLEYMGMRVARSRPRLN
ncbi:MAG TPA: prolyl oligopeptidase family serine peptidase [Candidatus Dormibacteraeota bacterium]|nr:prolyl oligopeptidase family serine peptidase [Candidatus Dormibacteraeota bacterium]